MSKIKGLFQKAWAAVANPGQDERVAVLVSAIGHAFTTQRRAFDLDKVLEPIDCTVTDVRVASKKYYEGLLQRFWIEGVPDTGKQKTLAFVEERLRLDAREVRQLREDVAVSAFGSKIGEYLADGSLSSVELQSLSEISSFLHLSVPQFVQQYLLSEGLGLLRGLFAEAVATGHLKEQTWNNLRISARSLGIQEEQLKSASRSISKSFAEHVLADTKADGVLTPQEETYLSWLVSTFEFDTQFTIYLRKEIQLLKDRASLESGHIDTIPVPVGINLKAGELLYVSEPCLLQITKSMKNGDRIDEHEGRIMLTDSRLLFESVSKTIPIAYPKIVSWRTSGEAILISAANKPELRFYFAQNPYSLLPEKFSTILRLHSQQLTRKVEGVVNRHIPRDVRQRVWQTYGGMCVECSATDYLEFDHIVPVARGGSNSEQNVQLLCRKCNLTKSDKI
ncbi:HNH endonuclease [Botrimarina mediterranea]|uniref:HNH endonuclease n=1 Tax=Botrimarina mediterranea TaxID=2528022 RepID=A0A518K6J2_9BACT|nr:HNH endonuclease signature motif containing protein [Botrimarina mediterranea]QDV73398.1 HNH endonuclease [Botrimarina mediterranea]QDV77915.1 HNH endonuclease [Planctomycetes bacterium K2D]